MKRGQKLALNTAIGIAKQLVYVICGFILPRYMLQYYGSTVNGLVSSITHFLGFISLLDMGVGAVVQANLYKPLADNDINQISRVYVSAQKFFRKIAVILVAYVVILCVLLPGTYSDNFSSAYSISLIIIIAIGTFSQFFFGIVLETLLTADQKAYVHMSVYIVTTIVNTVVSIFMIQHGLSIHSVKFFTACIYLVRPAIEGIYVKRHYSLDKKIKYIGEPIKQKWNGFSQHLASVINNNIDIIILSMFSTLNNVSVYSVYYMVISGITQIIMTAATGLESMFGNMIANEEKDILVSSFSRIEWLIHTVVTVVFTVSMIMIVPFVGIYTDGITDTNYIVPSFAMILVAAYAMQCLRVPYFRVIKAAGHFRQTKNGAYITAAINTFVSMLLVYWYGMIGIAIGTFLAMTFHTVYLAFYLKSNILNRSTKKFFLLLLKDVVVMFVTIWISNCLQIRCSNYLTWVIWAIAITVLTCFIEVCVSSMFEPGWLERYISK